MKTICVPASRPVDIAPFVPLIDHPAFQKMKHRKQLGVNHLIFPGAVHTRFEHLIGTLALTERVCNIQRLNRDDRLHLCAFALLHDIGHGPYSHQVEPVIGGSHHDNGLAILETMSDAVEACGLSMDRMVAFFCGKEPLHLFVSDRNLGTDKLDYLCRDALHIGFSGMPDVEETLQHTSICKGRIGVEEKAIEEVKRIQKFYSYLHQHGFLNKTALTLQRIFQRALQEELRTSGREETRLWEMTDQQCWHLIATSRSPLARSLFSLLEGRDFHRTVIAFKPRGYGFVERVAGKPILVAEKSQAFLQRFSAACHDYDRLLDVENLLAERLGLNPGDILFAAMPYFKKLLPKDVRIFTGEESYGLLEKDEDHTRSINGDYLRTFAVRVVVRPELREVVASRMDSIGDVIATVSES